MSQAKRLSAFLASAAFIFSFTVGGHAMEPTRSEVSATLDAIVNQGIAENFYPGAVLIVGTPTEVLHAQAYGRFAWDPESPQVTLDTIYDLASVSKAVGTATAAWVLLEDGTISLQDPVSKYIPGFEANGKESVTVLDLLTHVSGLKAYENRSVVEQSRQPDETPAQALIRTYAALNTSYTPRTSYVYSCLNFQTLAHVVEQAAGARMEDILRQRVWQPLGMQHTAYVLTDEQWQQTAPTHRRSTGEWVRAVHDPLASYHGSVESCPGNAGLFSTGPDLARYCVMVLQQGQFEGRQVFAPETIANATRRHTPEGVSADRGLGLDIFENPPYVTPLNKVDGARIVGHLGYTGTLVWMDTLSGTYFVFLTNRTFPHEEGKGDQTPNIAPFRNRVCDAVLRSRPQYREHFAASE